MLSYWARKVTEDDREFVDRFLFKIGGILELAHVYPIRNSPNQRISKEIDDSDDVVNAVIKESRLELTIIRVHPIPEINSPPSVRSAEARI